MLKDLFKRSLRRETRRSIQKIVTEAKQIKEALGDTLDDISTTAGDSSLGDALDGQVSAGSAAADNKAEELKIQQAVNKRNAQINDVIVGWVEKLDEFVSFINDPMNTDSIKYITDAAAPGSILEKVKSSEARRLTKVATECSALAQSLRSYITGGVDEPESSGVETEPAEVDEPALDDTEDTGDIDLDLGDDTEI